MPPRGLGQSAGPWGIGNPQEGVIARAIGYASQYELLCIAYQLIGIAFLYGLVSPRPNACVSGLPQDLLFVTPAFLKKVLVE